MTHAKEWAKPSTMLSAFQGNKCIGFVQIIAISKLWIFIQTVKDDNKAIKAELATIKTAVGEVSQFKAAISSKPSHEEVNAMKAHTREGQCQTTG